MPTSPSHSVISTTLNRSSRTRRAASSSAAPGEEEEEEEEPLYPTEQLEFGPPQPARLFT